MPPGRLDRVRELIERELGYRARFSHFPIVGLCASCHEEHTPCTFLTDSSSNEVARRGARSRRSRPSATACGAPRSTSTTAACPLLGVTAAFVFAAQMLNFPVAGGTSGHFLGAALAAVLLGPWLACLVLAVVLVVQAFVFADGGITALGANVLNMGVIGGCSWAG